MKRLSIFVFSLLLLVGLSVSSVQAQSEYYDRITIAAEGEFILFINFKFTVPSGNCGQLEVYEYIRSYPFFGEEAEWLLLDSGTETHYYNGIYRIVNNDTDCDPRVEFVGAPHELSTINSWSALEVEPEDLGLFVRKGWTPNNIFGLSEDDKEYSYDIVFNPFGYKASLEQILELMYICCNREIEGAITVNQRGFLKKQILWVTDTKFNRKAKNRIIDRDDIIVIIYKENYFY